MPGGDGTGPLGQGPMTGRAAGYCAGYPVPGYMNSVPGGGWGRGRGFGRGWGRGFGFGRGRGRGLGAQPWAYGAYGAPPYPGVPAPWPQPAPEQQADLLRQQAEFLQSELEAIRKRLDELAKDQAPS